MPVELVELGGYFFVYVGDRNLGWVAQSTDGKWWGNPYRGDGEYHMTKFGDRQSAVDHVVLSGI